MIVLSRDQSAALAALSPDDHRFTSCDHLQVLRLLILPLGKRLLFHPLEYDAAYSRGTVPFKRLFFRLRGGFNLAGSVVYQPGDSERVTDVGRLDGFGLLGSLGEGLPLLKEVLIGGSGGFCYS